MRWGFGVLMMDPVMHVGFQGRWGGSGLKSRLQSSGDFSARLPIRGRDQPGLREQVQNLIPLYRHISRVIISNPP